MIRLVEPTCEYENQVMSLRDNFLANGDSMDGTAGLRNYESYTEWIQDIELNSKEETVEEGLVPASTYLAVRKDDGKVVGIVDIRHRLNEYLSRFGGYIGYCVLKEERRKGYAKAIVALALEKCKELMIDDVLICCYKDNVASAKTIIANDGVLENEVIEDGELVQRYKIAL